MCVPPRRGARWRSQRYCTGFRSCPILSVSFLPTVILHSLHSWCIYIEIDGTFTTKSARKSTLSVSWSQNRNRYESRPNVVVPRCRLVVLLLLRPLPHCFLFGRHRSRDADASFDLREGGGKLYAFLACASDGDVSPLRNGIVVLISRPFFVVTSPSTRLTQRRWTRRCHHKTGKASLLR